ncbi:MAG TPA: hypothetical protein VMU16_14690 [Candidatus Binataceae bacterium]|nr:hypothetical protein [Candidatus Binataceae bacterium]
MKRVTEVSIGFAEIIFPKAGKSHGAPILRSAIVCIICGFAQACSFSLFGAPVAMPPLDAPPALPEAAAAPCPANSGYSLCFDAPAADALKRRIVLLKNDNDRCRAAYGKAAR